MSHEQGLKAGKWWALVSHRRDLPVIFETRRQAIENRCDFEYLVRVEITEVVRQKSTGKRAVARG